LQKQIQDVQKNLHQKWFKPVMGKLFKEGAKGKEKKL